MSQRRDNPTNSVIGVSVTLSGLQNRALVAGDPRRVRFFDPYRASQEALSFAVTLARDDLVSDASSHAISMVRDFFLRFGRDPSLEQLSGQQQELLSGS